MKVHNFSAGPCILPQEVFEKASKAVLNFNEMGLSILEISHRSPEFVEVIQNARLLALELLGLKTSDYTAIFVQGGASSQFLMTAQNFLNPNKTAGFLNTGTWAAKAIKEAKRFGNVIEIGSSQDKDYTYIPDVVNINRKVDYIHYTSNNTIYGTQMKHFPKLGNSLVFCDMSSDIFSRPLDYSQFDLIYAGAQKNIGPAGATLVVIKNEILSQANTDIPSMLNYNLIVERESMFNTPPVFSVYVSYLNLLWLKDQGGIKGIEVVNEMKARNLYQEIDRNTMFFGVAKKEDRSKMNVTFRLTNENFTEEFDILCYENNISGVKGHRSVGGYRASIYNALALESVDKLIEVMQKLEKNHK